jgi:2-iminobutanoate/2-iminopropanoate deaminase
MRTLALPLLASAALAACAPPAVTRKAVWPAEMPRGAPYSPGLLVGDTLYVASQPGWDPATKQLPADFADEAARAIENVGLVLRAGGMGFEDVVAAQVYLTDLTLSKAMNDVYARYFKEPWPARTLVGVASLVGGKGRIVVAVVARK